MHPDFESNLIIPVHIFRNSGVSRITGSDVIFSFIRGTKGVLHTVLSKMNAYQPTCSIHSTASSLSMLIFTWNKIFYLLMNVLHHHYGIDDVGIQTNAFSAISRNKLRLHKKNIHCNRLLNDIMKIILRYSEML